MDPRFGPQSEVGCRRGLRS